VVEHEVDPRPGRERGEFLKERERVEHEMARAIRPRRLEGEHDAAIVQQPEPALSHRRAEQLAAEMLQTRAVRGQHRDVDVEIEARQMGVPGGRGEHPRFVGIVPHAPHARAHTRTERDSPLNRGAADPGQGRRFFDHGVGPDEVGIAGIEAATFEQMLHPRGNPLEHDVDFIIRQRVMSEVCPLGERPILGRRKGGHRWQRSARTSRTAGSNPWSR
jgi:hypothetical protein